MEAKDLEWRMYGLVPYNISPIQQAIQYGHAVVEYFNKYNDDTVGGVFEWRTRDKTFIILNGGTTNRGITANNTIPEKHYKGSLNNHELALRRAEVNTATFYEPDLGDQLTAVVFLVDERVFDREKYPDRFLGGSPEPDENGFTPLIYFNPESEEAFEKRVGGPTNVWLREFLKQFRLA